MGEAYRAFHGYSIGNQFAALFECMMRGIEPSPIASYNAWKAKGRQVRRGEKAIVLCMPITMKAKTGEIDPATGEEKASTWTRFVWKPNWFVMSQTDGEPVEFPEIAGWDRAKALEGLGIAETEFHLLDGNTQGYAEGKAIAVNPVAAFPYKTTAHEMAHIILGHTEAGKMGDGERIPANMMEVEAEAVAMIVCDALDLPGADESRGYIQNWNVTGEPISEKSARRIFSAADRILRAGRGEDVRH